MERPEFLAEGFPIEIEDPKKGDSTIRINTAAYADDLILYSDKGESIDKFLALLAKYCSYTGMKINVKKCISLVETWLADLQDRVAKPFYYRQCFGLDPSGNEKWGDEEMIPMQTSSLYLGTTIAFNREDDAKHGKHLLDSMQENIDQIGSSRLNITQKMHAIKTFELPRIDFRMMCGGLTQSDLRKFDSWLRGRIDFRTMCGGLTQNRSGSFRADPSLFQNWP
jgi:hypothetical protein